jgi:hypothetical protein
MLRFAEHSPRLSANSGKSKLASLQYSEIKELISKPLITSFFAFYKNTNSIPYVTPLLHCLFYFFLSSAALPAYFISRFFLSIISAPQLLFLIWLLLLSAVSPLICSILMCLASPPITNSSFKQLLFPSLSFPLYSCLLSSLPMAPHCYLFPLYL